MKFFGWKRKEEKHPDPLVRPDWNTQMLSQIEDVGVAVHINVWLDNSGIILSGEDRERLYEKLELVRKVAEKLTRNMLKGTLKYQAESDWQPVDVWLDYLADDAADTLNYAYLAKRSLEKERASCE